MGSRQLLTILIFDWAIAYAIAHWAGPPTARGFGFLGVAGVAALPFAFLAAAPFYLRSESLAAQSESAAAPPTVCLIVSVDLVQPPSCRPTHGDGRPIKLLTRAISFDGRRLPVVPGWIAGRVDLSQEVPNGLLGNLAPLAGWAARPQDHHPASSILIFSSGRFLGAIKPTISRPDVAQAYKDKALERSGYIVELRLALAQQEKKAPTVQLFGVEAGAASLLPCPHPSAQSAARREGRGVRRPAASDRLQRRGGGLERLRRRVQRRAWTGGCAGVQRAGGRLAVTACENALGEGRSHLDADFPQYVSGSACTVSVVVPNWNGRDWLPACLEAVYRQTLAPAEVIVVDNGSDDGSIEYLRADHPEVRVLPLGANTGFAHAANRGIEASTRELVALINTDVVLARDWLERLVAALRADPGLGAVACKMLSLEDPTRVYDAGDVLRRDGACEQRGRFGLDDGRWDEPGEVFGACAGAALYRRTAVVELGGFDERYFAYLEDVDLALRLRLAGWRCRYEPAVALHAGEGSSHQLQGGHHFLVTRNTLVLVTKTFPLGWLPFVAYRQIAWAWHALRERRLGAHLRGLVSAMPLLPWALRERRSLLRSAQVPVRVAVPARPFRGPQAGGHPAQIAGTGQRPEL